MATSQASHARRVFAFILALLFFVTTLAVTGFYLWNYSKEGQTSSQNTQDSPQKEPDVNTQNQPQSKPQAQDQKPLTCANKTKGYRNSKQKPTKLQDFKGPLKIEKLRCDLLIAGNKDQVVKAGDRVTIHYSGGLATDGTVFDSSLSGTKPVTFALGSLIRGWQLGIPGMKVGEKRRLYIPAKLAYGPATADYKYQQGGPVLGDLIFDIELFAINLES